MISVVNILLLIESGLFLKTQWLTAIYKEKVKQRFFCSKEVKLKIFLLAFYVMEKFLFLFLFNDDYFILFLHILWLHRKRFLLWETLKFF